MSDRNTFPISSLYPGYTFSMTSAATAWKSIARIFTLRQLIFVSLVRTFGFFRFRLPFHIFRPSRSPASFAASFCRNR